MSLVTCRRGDRTLFAVLRVKPRLLTFVCNGWLLRGMSKRTNHGNSSMGRSTARTGLGYSGWLLIFLVLPLVRFWPSFLPGYVPPHRAVHPHCSPATHTHSTVPATQKHLRLVRKIDSEAHRPRVNSIIIAAACETLPGSGKSRHTAQSLGQLEV